MTDSLKRISALYILQRGIAYQNRAEVVQDCIEYVDSVRQEQRKKQRDQLERVRRRYWIDADSHARGLPWWRDRPEFPRDISLWTANAGSPLDNIRFG